MSERVPIAIVGPTGYTGLELIEILLRHPSMRPAYLASARDEPTRIDHEFPRLRDRIAPELVYCRPVDHDAVAAACELVFLCLPHEAAMEHAPEFLRRGLKVVDLSAAYRIRDSEVYQKAYGHPHTDAAGLREAVYGLTEWARDAVRGARLVANPGCYPTAAAIALIPLLRAGLIHADSIVISAASGVSGAGRQPKPNLQFVEASENFSAYNIGVHRHQPEIAQSLGVWGSVRFERAPLFVPHLLPVERGILGTIIAEPTRSALETGEVMGALRDAYAGERFAVVREDAAPTLRDVQRTNTVHVNARVSHGRVVVVAAIDNLVKGASGQAVQNANVMLGLEECAGLGG